MCKLWIKMNIKSKMTIRQMNQPKIQNIKQRTGKILLFFTQRTRAHTISNQKCNTHNCEWDRDRMSGFGAHTDGNTRTDRYFVLQWTEIDEKKKSLYDITITTVSLFLSLTYALTSVISFGFLCVRSHMLYVTEYVCVGMLLCACVHFGI